MRMLIKSCVVLFMIWSHLAAAQTFQATVNRTDVPQGETFLLTLETDDNQSDITPDLKELDKDFKIYSVGNAFQSSFINGAITHSRQWQIVLMPTKSGEIEIPAIKYGNLVSDPIKINVVPAKFVEQPNKGKEAPKFAVDAEVNNKNPFVQQQIIYTYKLYDSGGLYGDAPVFMDDGSNDWIVKGLGEPKVNSRVINGRQLREIEFKYALFPQKSGKLKTPDIEFKGYYVTQNSGNVFDDIFNRGFFNVDIHDMFATRNPIALKPDSMTIDVKPVPEINGGYWWLPASQVILTSEWKDKNPVFRVGEAVSLSVYLKAVGVIENQLPDIKFKEIEGVKQYPEKPVTMGAKNNDNIISIKQFNNVYIPEKAGKMTIPEISIDWYNVNSGKIEKAVLPAQTVTVLAGQGTENNEEIKDKTIKQEEDISEPSPVKEETQKTTSVAAEPSLPMWFLLCVTFILGVIVSWFLFGRNKEKGLSIKAYAKEVEAAAMADDIKSVRDSLLDWARVVYHQNKISNLDEIKKYGISPIFEEQLKLIGKMLYSTKKENFDKKEFIRIFREEQKRQKKQSANKLPLPKLYK